MEVLTFSYKKRGTTVIITVPRDVLQTWMIYNDLLPPMSGPADVEDMRALMDDKAVLALIEDAPLLME